MLFQLFFQLILCWKNKGWYQICFFTAGVATLFCSKAALPFEHACKVSMAKVKVGVGKMDMYTIILAQACRTRIRHIQRPITSIGTLYFLPHPLSSFTLQACRALEWKWWHQRLPLVYTKSFALPWRADCNIPPVSEHSDGGKNGIVYMKEGFLAQSP